MPILMAVLSLCTYPTEAQSACGNNNVISLENSIKSYHRYGGSRSEYLALLYELGLAYSCEGHYLKANDSLAKSLEIKEQFSGKTDSTYSNMLTSYAESLMHVGSFDRAKKALLEALRLNSSIHGAMSLQVIQALNNLANLFGQVGMNMQSLDLFQTALSISIKKYGHNHLITAGCLSNVGGSYFKNGELEMALRRVNDAEMIYLQAPDHTKNIAYIETLEKEGMINEVMGHLDKAERILLRTYDLKLHYPNISPNLLLETLNDLGILYRDLGNHNKAAEFFELARQKAINELGDDHYYYATFTNNLAGLMHLDGDYSQALKYYLEASEIFLDYFGEYNSHYATSLNNIAGIYRLMKDYDKSKEFYLKVIEIDRSILGEGHPDYAKVINNLGILYTSMGKPNLAEPLYLKAIELRGDHLGFNHPSYASSLENLGLHYFNQGENLKAEEFFRKALNLREKQIASIFPALTEKERIQFYNSTREDIERYCGLALKLHKEKSVEAYIYNIRLSTKAIIYYASNKMRKAIMDSGDPQLIAQYNQWRTLNSRKLRYYQLGQNVLNDLNINIKEFESKIDSIEKNIALRSTVFYEGINRYKPIRWQDVRRVLKPGEAAIEIIRLREFEKGLDLEDAGRYGFSKKITYLAIVLRFDSKEPQLIQLSNGNAMENEYFNLYRNSIQYDLKTDHSYKYYWQQIDEQLSGITRVFISPDGIYNKINPNIIYDGKEDKYLIDEIDIHYVSNTKDLVQKRHGSHSRNVTAKTVELFGNANFESVSLKGVKALQNMPRLPGTSKEVNALDSMFQSKGWKTTVHRKMQASEQAAKKLNSPRVLHIATHGFFLTDRSIIGDHNPLLKSGLVLSDNDEPGTRHSETDDGILTAYEAMNLNLENTELVVLSACETGLGEVENGEGIFGLQRSFLVAGTDALILSLFKVGDEATSKLMTLFYSYYLETGQIFESFKKAQIELRKSYDSPLTWGSFIVVGA